MKKYGYLNYKFGQLNAGFAGNLAMLFKIELLKCIFAVRCLGARLQVGVGMRFAVGRLRS